jgi:hypothetical protein
MPGVASVMVSVPDRPPQLPTDRVAAELRARITAGEWARDEQLPSVAALADQHNTSRATMSRAIWPATGASLPIGLKQHKRRWKCPRMAKPRNT